MQVSPVPSEPVQFSADSNVPDSSPSLQDILVQRGNLYGEYKSNAFIAQQLKSVMRAQPGWELLIPSTQEFLDMAASKIARILNGDQLVEDNFLDISGYATLALDEVQFIKAKQSTQKK